MSSEIRARQNAKRVIKHFARLWSAVGSEAPHRFRARKISQSIRTSHKAVSPLRSATALQKFAKSYRVLWINRFIYPQCPEISCKISTISGI